MKYLLVCSFLLVGMNTYGCPFTITNDTEHEFFVTDGNMHATYIGPQQMGTIDPTIKGSFIGFIPHHWFFSEKLHIYQKRRNQNTFYKHFLLTEKYCSDDTKENTFTMRDIEQLPESFTKRFNVITYPMPKEPFVTPSKH